MRTRAPLGTALVVALLAAITFLGTAMGHPSERAARSTQVEVEGATAVCPDLRQNGDAVRTRVTVGAAPLPGGRTGTGGRVLSHPNSRPRDLATVPVSAPGQVATGLSTQLRDDALVVTSTGPLSAGLEAEQVTRGESGRDRGLAGLRCEAPRTEAWFLGGGASTVEETTLVLANVDDLPATLDITVFTSSGPADARRGQGVTLNPHTRQVINLDTLAPDRRLLGVHVHSRRGRVAAAMRTSIISRRVPLGADWIPQSVPPATTVVVPGIPQLDPSLRGSRLLLVGNPGADDTTVSVQLTTSDGQFVPAGLDQVKVPAGTTVGVPLESEAEKSPLSVRVVSEDVPVLASAFVGDGQDNSPAHDLGYTAGTLPLSGPALLTDLVIDRPTESTLILSAPDEAAVVRVSLIRVVGTTGALPATKVIHVPAGRTVTLRLSTFYRPGDTVKAAVEVRPVEGSGPVYAARYLRERGAHGPLTTLLNLQGPSQTVTRPAVVEDRRSAN